MNAYVCILGRNMTLSVAELKAVFADAEIIYQDEVSVILDLAQAIDCQKILNRLGGTIKIGKIIGHHFDKEIIIENLKKIAQESKLHFGLSFYNGKADQKIGLEIKKALKQAGINSRLVVSREKVLSSVVVAKNKCYEFMILKNGWLAQTCAVQEFESYAQRDFGRPQRDMVSGSMPPKLAQIMINLAAAKQDEVLLDPFCGSGTIVQEALLFGFKKVIGTDISSKAVAETKENISWLQQNYQIGGSADISLVPVETLSTKIKSADCIVTEPFLGPPLRGHESDSQLLKNIHELEVLYIKAFEQFANVLKAGGRVVIIFPYFTKLEKTLDIIPKIISLGFSQINNEVLFYSRPDQKVWRQIFVFEK